MINKQTIRKNTLSECELVDSILSASISKQMHFLLVDILHIIGSKYIPILFLAIAVIPNRISTGFSASAY